MPRFACAMVSILALGFAAVSWAEISEEAAPCAACHGTGGNSTNPEWPKLAGQHPGYTRNQLAAFKSGDRTNTLMSPIAAALGEEDINSLADYFAAQTRQPGVAKKALAEAGAKIYRGGNLASGVPACMACHGPRGAGNPPAGYPALGGQHAAYTANQMRAYRSGERSTDVNAVMRTIAARMSEAEIEAVASYLEGLH
ncbi:MAG: c-type cytochrome [Chromatiales bacterium]